MNTAIPLNIKLTENHNPNRHFHLLHFSLQFVGTLRFPLFGLDALL